MKPAPPQELTLHRSSSFPSQRESSPECLQTKFIFLSESLPDAYGNQQMRRSLVVSWPLSGTFDSFKLNVWWNLVVLIKNPETRSPPMGIHLRSTFVWFSLLAVNAVWETTTTVSWVRGLCLVMPTTSGFIWSTNTCKTTGLTNHWPKFEP